MSFELTLINNTEVDPKKPTKYIQMGKEQVIKVFQKKEKPKPSLGILLPWGPLMEILALWWLLSHFSLATELGLCLEEHHHAQLLLLQAISQAPHRSLWPTIHAEELSCSSCCLGLHFQPTPAPDLPPGLKN